MAELKVKKDFTLLLDEEETTGLHKLLGGLSTNDIMAKAGVTKSQAMKVSEIYTTLDQNI